jgi:hypothetical protein
MTGKSTVRTVLAAFGFVQLVNGLWALLAPRSFYAEFPLGRGWVELLPAYNDHLMRDVGGLYLATAGLLLGAAIVRTKATVVIACVSWLMFALPHALYHAFHLGPFGTADAIANPTVLSAAVLLPAWVLAAVARRQPVREARRAAGRSTFGGRVEGVPDGTRNLLIRAGFRASRRRYGAVMEPLRVFAHHPKVMVGYAALEMASERSDRVSARVKHLAELRRGWHRTRSCANFPVMTGASVLRSPRSSRLITRRACPAARWRSPTLCSISCESTSMSPNSSS